jgi:hypothetical protein
MKKSQEITRSTPGKPQGYTWFERLMRVLGWERSGASTQWWDYPIGGFLVRAEGEISDDPKLFEVRFTFEQKRTDGEIEEESVFLHLNEHQLIDLGDKFTMAAVGLAHGIDGPRSKKEIFPIPLERDDNIEREVP